MPVNGCSATILLLCYLFDHLALSLFNVNLCLYLDGVELVDARPEVVRVSSKCDFQQRQKAVHPGQQTLRTEERIESSSRRQCSINDVNVLLKRLSGYYVLAAVILEGMPSNTMTRSAR